ncbi:MFS transporter [Sphingomonas hengshuiensis]|uniref:Major facilitator transporter n=1 Tax=Sphingomonas hengshuiensis TaxID=1609977 RepID=A0A7U4J7F7_9SPHN|nr:MFS transporter [Sphingomonas hengshuiensis]AJP71629.1 major facilitator transporter [Sphingomonas hengshuiensis]
MPEDVLPQHHRATRKEKMVIAASSLGTVFEWYDFYLYGLLATTISAQFFAGVNDTTAFIFALAAFAAGFAVRPFGALVFGRIGDLVGRKNTFLVTMGIMGGSTFAVGLLPNFATAGVLAPILLVTLRVLQGLALGGQYGGAATYVAEHAPDHKRGLYTSWIQTTATLGLFASLLVVIGTRSALGEAAFAAWGWRVPFLASVFLLGVSLWVRLQLNESPVYAKMKATGNVSKAPLTEAFLRWGNLRIVLIALFGAVVGQAVVWYTGQFYALFFLEKTLKVDGMTANVLIAVALALGTPFFVFFGWLSDKIGRKPIILAGCALAALTYFPLFHALTMAANPALAEAQARAAVVLSPNQTVCSVQFDPIGKNKFDSTPCDVVKAYLAKTGVPYSIDPATIGDLASGSVALRIGNTRVDPPATALLAAPATRAATVSGYQKQLQAALTDAGYPAKADPARVDHVRVVAILFALVLLVTMVYGPIAAMLVELFPSRIRYTSMSLPYHIGNGWFGGFLPATAFAMVAATGDIYYGLWYPVIAAAATLVIGLLLLPDTRRHSIHD